MVAGNSGFRGSVERTLRSMCRCDGLKDLAVVAALLVITGAFAIRIASAPRDRSGHTAVIASLLESSARELGAYQLACPWRPDGDEKRQPSRPLGLLVRVDRSA
jgi:hypothetical protein